jgi:S-methylmethionine-dependent homocysteine/selenocysteine methylase
MVIGREHRFVRRQSAGNIGVYAMAKYRSHLPQCNSNIFMTDGGLETTLIFREGIELPEFAAFVLFKSDTGMQALRKYFTTYAELAQRYRIGLMLDSATWRANPDWGRKLGYSDPELANINRLAIQMLEEVRAVYETDVSKMVISGSIGPRGDGYAPSSVMSVDEAAQYHSWQIEVFAGTQTDMVTAFTMNYAEEALGIAQAAKRLTMPVAISFTAETDGKLPTGQTLREAIARTDAETDAYPMYYMINCAHPTHFMPSLDTAGDWLSRIYGLRANASSKSHAELNEATELDDGNPSELAGQYRDVKRLCPIFMSLEDAVERIIAMSRKFAKHLLYQFD